MAIELLPPKGHIITLTMLAWGHVKSACSLLAKIIRSRPIHATIFVAFRFVEKAGLVLDELFMPSEDEMRNLIRVVGVECDTSPLDSSRLVNNFLIHYKCLFSSELAPVQSGDMGSRLPCPSLIILDPPLYHALRGIRSISGRNVPVYALQSANVAGMLFRFGPESMGGAGDLHAKFKNVIAMDKPTKDAEVEKIYRRMTGKLLDIPGLPQMYDHEHQPQRPIFPMTIAYVSEYIHRFVSECDGVIMNSSPILEKDALEAFQEWLGDRPVINVGPFDFPVIDGSDKMQRPDTSPTNPEVELFLSTTLEKYGPKSLIYISFGSVFWSTEPEKIWTMLDVLIEQGVPFIFSHASPFAAIPIEVETKISKSKLGYSTTWAPQTDILRHEVCGWFITHGGQNSVTEALSVGVPLICWPFEGDQPSNAAYISAVHNVGYELFEVRTGPGLRPIHRLRDWTPSGTLEAVRGEIIEVLGKTRSSDGDVKRNNARMFQNALAKSWAKDGESWREMRKITEFLK